MIEKEKYIGQSTPLKTPDKPLRFKLGPQVVKPENLTDNCFTADKIAPGAITTDKLADGAVTLDKISSDISNSLLQLVIKDVAKIWDKIADITGEQLQDLTFEVSPKYFISEEPMPVHVNASSVGNNAMFDHIAFYINGILIHEESGVESVEFNTTISDTSEIKYKASVMGTEYTDAATVVHYNSFWLGAGAAYTEIMDLEHIIPITDGMRGAYDVTFRQADRLYIILSTSLREQFIRADMNSFEIPFNETIIRVEEKTYSVLESVNQYNAGTYNIDING